MPTDTFLMIPGPTPLPEAVREVLGRPAIGHRSPEFKAVLQRVFPGLQRVFKTQHPVFVYTASATGAMEGAMQNTLNPGDNVLVLCCGVFSERWADMAESLGMAVTRVQAAHGEANTVEALQAALENVTTAIQAVVITHSETSTGVLNPVQELAKVLRGDPHTKEALIVVDAVTSLLASPFAMDAWDLDMVVSGSQKGFMLPPGIAFLAVGPRAFSAHQRVKYPGYYFHFARTRKSQEAFSTPYTPATPQIVALDAALTMLEAEGIDNTVARHRQLRTWVREGITAMGLTPFVTDDTIASDAVTAIVPPAGMSVDTLRKELKQRFGIVVANGQKSLEGKIFRIGHLGHIYEREVRMTLAALKAVLEGN